MALGRTTARRTWLVAGLIAAGLAAAVLVAILLTQRAALAAPAQPIPFRHDRHTQAGVQCLYCHPDALRSDIAGIPSVEKCMGCHLSIAAERPAIQILAGYWERQEPIPWERISPAVDHVFFSHQPHLSGGVGCESCHGDVGSMGVTRPVLLMDMGWCLRCHLEQPEEKVARLADCMTCHK